MHTPRISMIAAIGKNRELGKQGQLVWRISEDLKRVKALTTGHPIIMGRKTYESIGHPLPNRTNIVVSRTQAVIDGCTVTETFEQAVEVAREIEEEEIFIFGGSQLFEVGIMFAHRLYLTVIDAENPNADVFFPDYSDFKTIISSEPHPEHVPPYTYITLER